MFIIQQLYSVHEITLVVGLTSHIEEGVSEHSASVCVGVRFEIGLDGIPPRVGLAQKCAVVEDHEICVIAAHSKVARRQ